MSNKKIIPIKKFPVLIDDDEITGVPIDSDAFNDRFYQSRQQAINNEFYRTTIDKWKPTSVNELKSLMIKFCFNKYLLDQAWIIFYWISQNIDYDIVSYFSDRLPNQDIESVFKTRKGVCSGFATMFKTLADCIQLSCHEISGNTKGFGYSVNNQVKKFDHSDHAWNTIEINHHLYLIDSTWGSGHIDNKRQYKKELNLFYFCIRPEQIIYSHLPENSKDQLLLKPLTMKQFLILPKVYSYFFDFNLKIISPKNTCQAEMKSNEFCSEILIKAPDNIHLSCKIKKIIHMEQKIINGDFIQYDNKNKLWQCLFAPNGVGNYELTVYAKQSIDTGYYHGAVEFNLNVDVQQQNFTFPTQYALFMQKMCQLFEPLNGIIKRASKITIHCFIPSAQSVMVIVNEEFLDEEGYDKVTGIFKRQINTPKRGGTVGIYAKFDSKNREKWISGYWRSLSTDYPGRDLKTELRSTVVYQYYVGASALKYQLQASYSPLAVY
ncbi:unnamed protein product [Didymodactylos carnosus]|uniref:Transglutaminase-like domain-containing protein n=1 Tax=Didymodactylos carnosus TaxID=1234261 RepID=A0A814UPN3_9BILA|nr:unnamed protein product [Didymodactylos carnosus]CAF1176251.1 unnamed protein product [Didymodactylos carnosus]CAF3742694.1 unnamed protein product [Didymodactylos carnosus]CAF3940291.1 unnamed protein product [Didymodactylos carnosus]